MEAENDVPLQELASVLQQLRADAAASASERAQLRDDALEQRRVVALQQAAMDEQGRLVARQTTAL